MAVRGSGIGASAMALGTSQTSLRSGSANSVYAQPTGVTGAKASTHTVLLVLVVLELAALLWMRHAFRHHHGG